MPIARSIDEARDQVQDLVERFGRNLDHYKRPEYLETRVGAPGHFRPLRPGQQDQARHRAGGRRVPQGDRGLARSPGPEPPYDDGPRTMDHERHESETRNERNGTRKVRKGGWSGGAAHRGEGDAHEGLGYGTRDDAGLCLSLLD